MFVGTDWLTNVASSLDPLGVFAKTADLLSNKIPRSAIRGNLEDRTGAFLQQQTRQSFGKWNQPNESQTRV
jgi:hypothetical protein